MAVMAWHLELHLLQPGPDLLLHVSLGASLMLLLALGLSRAAQRLGPVVRHQILAAGAAGALLTGGIALGQRIPTPSPSEAPGGDAGAEVPRILPANSRWVASGFDEDRPPAPAGTVLFAIWGAGTLLLTMRSLRSRARVAALLREAEPVSEPCWLPELRAAAHRLGVMEPRLVHLPGRSSPFVTGLRRPTLVLDDSALASVGEERRAILAHELEHVRRRDPLWTLLAMLVRTLYWPLPPAWWVSAAMRLEAERSCDQSVLRAGVSAPAYLRHLLRCDAQAADLGWSVSPMRSTQLYRRLRSLGSEPLASMPGTPLIAGVWLVLTLAGVGVGTAGPAGGQAVFFSDDPSAVTGSRETPQVITFGLQSSSPLRIPP